MKRDQTFHERLIPMLVEGIGAHTYVEIGTDANQTISKVAAPVRVGVDPNAVELEGCTMFKMTCDAFAVEHAAKFEPIDFLFIDANHEAAHVRSDFMSLWPFVADNGMVALHDVQPENLSDAQPGFCHDAWKFAYYLVAGGFEACTINYHPGLMLVRKRDSWGPKQ